MAENKRAPIGLTDSVLQAASVFGTEFTACMQLAWQLNSHIIAPLGGAHSGSQEEEEIKREGRGVNQNASGWLPYSGRLQNSVSQF